MSEQAPAPQPSLWQRATGAVKNFFSHAIGFIPRGILFTGFVFAASALLESQTGVGLGVLEAAKGGALLQKFALHIAFGSMLSGVIGAATTPCIPCPKTGEANAVNNPLLSKREAQLGEYVAKTLGDQATQVAQTSAVDAVVPGGGLPAQFMNKIPSQQPAR